MRGFMHKLNSFPARSLVVSLKPDVSFLDESLVASLTSVCICKQDFAHQQTRPTYTFWRNLDHIYLTRQVLLKGYIPVHHAVSWRAENDDTCSWHAPLCPGRVHCKHGSHQYPMTAVSPPLLAIFEARGHGNAAVVPARYTKSR